MPLPKEIAAELEAMRSRLLKMLVPLQSQDDSSPGDEQATRYSLWSAVHALEPVLREEHAPVDLDLEQTDNATREALYDFVIWDYFTPHALDDPGDIIVPCYTPEECGLRVFFEHGRWFVTWLKLEQDSSLPEAKRRELLMFEKDDEDGRLVLSEV